MIFPSYATCTAARPPDPAAPRRAPPPAFRGSPYSYSSYSACSHDSRFRFVAALSLKYPPG